MCFLHCALAELLQKEAVSLGSPSFEAKTTQMIQHQQREEPLLLIERPTHAKVFLVHLNTERRRPNLSQPRN